MVTVGSYEAKTHLAELLDRVARGEEIVITRHGTPVARLVPAHPERQADVAAVVRQLKEFPQKHGIQGLSTDEIRAMIEEGRR